MLLSQPNELISCVVFCEFESLVANLVKHSTIIIYIGHSGLGSVTNCQLY